MHPEKSSKDEGIGRSVVSLLLVIHLLCVGTVLASNFRRSPLQAQLVSIFAPYTKLLHFDPEFTPYYYTLGRPSDDDAWIAVDLYASADQPVAQQEVAKQLRLPEGGNNWLEGRRRLIQLAKLLAERGESEADDDLEVASELVKGIGSWAMDTTGNRRAVVRVFRRMSQPYNLAVLNPGFPPERPADPAYDAIVYEADVWSDEDQQVQVQKRASRAEVAPRRGSTAAPGSDAPGGGTPSP
jgi:hypothetical protein